MDFRIVSLPPFQAASSGLVKDFDFSPEGTLGKFNDYFSAITPSPRDSFMPRDFLCFDGEAGGMVWLYAISEGMDDGGWETVDCEADGIFCPQDPEYFCTCRMICRIAEEQGRHLPRTRALNFGPAFLRRFTTSGRKAFGDLVYCDESQCSDASIQCGEVYRGSCQICAGADLDRL